MHIVVPTDFSDFGLLAIKTATSMALKNNAKIDVVHVVQTPIDWVKMDVISPSGAEITFKDVEHNFPEVEKVVAFSKAKLAEIKGDLSSRGIDVQTHLVFNRPIVEAINENMKEDSIVVMGSHGASGLKEVTIGSNAQKVVREIQFPVLIVKEDRGEFDPKNIVYASSFEEDNLNEMIGEAAKFALSYGAKLNLLCINTPANFKDTNAIQNRLDDVVNEFDLENCSTHIFNHFTIDYGIHDFLSNDNFDLLIMPSHGYKGIQRLISFGVVEGMVNHVDIPILKYSVKQ